MARLAVVHPSEFRQVLVEAFAVNERMNQLLLEHPLAPGKPNLRAARGGPSPPSSHTFTTYAQSGLGSQPRI